MPEMPDVEVFRKYCNRTSLNQKINEVDARNKKILERVSLVKLKKELVGNAFTETRRHGKHLFLKCGRAWLHLHFGMTGFLKYFKRLEDDPAHDGRMLISFDSGYHLAYINQRLLGAVGLVDSVDGFISEKKLGPDVDGLSPEEFRDIIESGRGTIKSRLMKQEAMAGLGNVYTDEVLFQAKIHPEKRVKDISRAEKEDLYYSMRDVLKTAVHKKADPEKVPDTWLLPRRDRGEKCPRCGSTVKKITVTGRGTWFCPRCQE